MYGSRQSVALMTIGAIACHAAGGVCAAAGLSALSWAPFEAALNTSESDAHVVDATWASLPGLGELLLTERQVNSFTGSAQDHATIAARPGGWIVAWDSRRQEAGTYGVRWRFLGPSGEPDGPEHAGNLWTRSHQTHPAISALADGAFWLVWESFGQDGSASAVIARRFDAEGRGGNEICVNERTWGEQVSPTVAALPDGGAVVAWVTPGEDRHGTCVAWRVLDPDGRPAGSEKRASLTADWAAQPSLTADAAGRVALAWSTADELYESGAITIVMLDESGAVVYRPLAVVDGDGRSHLPVEPAIAWLDDGRLGVVWHEPAGRDYGVFAKAVNQDGQSSTKAVRVSPAEDQHVTGGAIVSLDGERCGVTWTAIPADGGKPTVRYATVELDGAAAKAMNVASGVDGSRSLPAGGGSARIVRSNDSKAFSLALTWSGECPNDHNGVGAAVFHDAPTSGRTQAATSVKAADVLALRCELDADVPPAPLSHEPPIYDPALILEEPFGGDWEAGLRDEGAGFIGVTNTGWTPPDPQIAVGLNHIVVITNGAIAFLQKDGTRLFQQAIEGGGGFWGSVGALDFVFDPEVLFDPHTGRFMAMANERADDSSYFLLAVSDDGDPTGAWNKYRFDVTPAAGSGIDSPNIAVDDEFIYLSADFFSPDRFLTTVVDKADVLAGAAAPWRLSVIGNGPQSYGTPVMYDADAPALYQIHAGEFGTYDTVSIRALFGFPASPDFEIINVTVPQYSHPEDPPQLGTTVRPELFEARFWSCVYRDGSLWAVHHVNGSRVRVRWYEFEMRGWPASGQMPVLAQWGEIDPGGDARTFFPSIWVDDAGNAAITCTLSSPTTFFDMVWTYRLAGDPPGAFRPLETAKASAAPYPVNRWGDYSGTVSDPTRTGLFWGHSEYTPGASSWNTWVARYTIDCNGNGMRDECEVDCGQPGGDCFDVPGCGTAADCNENLVPDSCELLSNDCNGNNQLDECDLLTGDSEDCNSNGYPDDCELVENDCNDNQIPDDCEVSTLFLETPAGTVLCPGGDFALSVEVDATGPEYLWRRNGVALDGGDPRVSGANGPVLTITDAAAADAGLYDCQVAVGCLVGATPPAEVEILPPVTITQQPVESVRSCANRGLALTVAASGAGTLSYDWRKDGASLGAPSSPRLVIAAPLTVSDAGDYTCLVTGACGSAESHASVVSILMAYSVQPQGGCAELGSRIELSATAPGAVGWEWYHDGVRMVQRLGGDTDTYVIDAFSAADEGAWWAVAYSFGAEGCVVNSESAVLTAGPCTHCGTPGDIDLDHDLDLVDLAGLQQCYGSLEGAPGNCICLDDDEDGDVDDADWAALEQAVTGPQ